MVAGTMHIVNGQMGLSDGDMVYNVDSKPIVVNGVTMKPGECSVIRGGVLEKIPDQLKP